MCKVINMIKSVDILDVNFNDLGKTDTHSNNRKKSSRAFYSLDIVGMCAPWVMSASRRRSSLIFRSLFSQNSSCSSWRRGIQPLGSALGRIGHSKHSRPPSHLLLSPWLTESADLLLICL